MHIRIEIYRRELIKIVAGNSEGAERYRGRLLLAVKGIPESKGDRRTKKTKFARKEAGEENSREEAVGVGTKGGRKEKTEALAMNISVPCL